jgi:hypothetical protein
MSILWQRINSGEYSFDSVASQKQNTMRGITIVLLCIASKSLLYVRCADDVESLASREVVLDL